MSFLSDITGSLFGGGGGGGGQASSPSPVQTTTNYNAVSNYAAPYVEGMLGKTQALVDQPYQTYGGQRTAEFTGLNNQAFNAARGLGTAQQTTDASNMAAQAGLGALNTQYQGGMYGNAYQGLNQYDPGQFGMMGVNSQNFGGRSAEQYMSPYVQQALAPQMEQIQRFGEQQKTRNAGQATQAGAFGGSRFGIQNALTDFNTQQAQSQAYGTGIQNAYQNAQAQFNADQARRLQAQQSNQQMLLATQQAQQQANQFGYGQAANQAQTAAQYQQAANQLNAQQEQFGANLGLQGLQTGLTAANTLGTLGQNQYAQTVGNINLQNQLGTQQQQQQQNILNQQYQDFLTQKQDPYSKLSFQQSMLSGLPLSATTQNVYSNPSMLSQVAGLGTAAAGAYGLSKGIKKGGKIQEQRPAGLAELALSKMA